MDLGDKKLGLKGRTLENNRKKKLGVSHRWKLLKLTFGSFSAIKDSFSETQKLKLTIL